MISIPLVLAAMALATDVPIALLQAVCWKETGHRNLTSPMDGRSPSYGICQLKLATARQFEPGITSAQLLNPWTNARIAALYLRHFLTRYHNNVSCAVYAYNRGHAPKPCRQFDNSDSSTNNNYVRRVRQASVIKPWMGNQ